MVQPARGHLPPAGWIAPPERRSIWPPVLLVVLIVMAILVIGLLRYTSLGIYIQQTLQNVGDSV